MTWGQEGEMDGGNSEDYPASIYNVDPPVDGIQKIEDEARAAVALLQRGASTEWPQYPSEWENLERTAKKLSKALADRRNLMKSEGAS